MGAGVAFGGNAPVASRAVNGQALVLRPDVVVTLVDDGALLLDLATKFFFSVNHAGVPVVEALEDGIATAAVEEVAGPFVQALREEGLVVPGPAGRSEAPAIDGVPALEKHREPLPEVMVSAFDPSIPMAE